MGEFDKTMSRAGARLSDAGEEASASIGKMASDAMSGIKDSLEAQKTAGAEAIGHLARSTGEAADRLEGQAPGVARMIKDAAGSVERASRDIQEQSLDDLVRTVSDFARRQPVLFAGLGVVAGFLIARAMRAGPHRS
jgi:hypothetical protein